MNIRELKPVTYVGILLFVTNSFNKKCMVKFDVVDVSKICQINSSVNFKYECLYNFYLSRFYMQGTIVSSISNLMWIKLNKLN